MKKLVIDLRAVKSNLQTVRSKANGAAVYADLSGDAYGMGLLKIAGLARDCGINTFIVSEPWEAELLRERGFTDSRLLMLRSTADRKELSRMLECGVICTVGSYDAALAIDGIAKEYNTVFEVQIKIDSGLGRYGFMPDELDKISSIYKNMPNLAVVGVFTTYSAPLRNKKLVQAQEDSFREVLDKLRGMGYDPGVTHACESSALFRHKLERFDAVRAGAAICGRIPGAVNTGLYRIGCIKASVEEVGWFPKDHQIGNTRLKKPARLAVLSVGNYHGVGITQQDTDLSIFELLRNKFRKMYVKVNGERAVVVGNVGMMHTVVDVTNVQCAVGDEVVLDVDPVNVKGLPIKYISEMQEADNAKN